MNSSSVSEFYDFGSQENTTKWKGLLINGLKKVLEQVHPSLGAREDALEYIEQLCLRLLAMLCAKPSPHTVQDVESRVQNTFPTPIDKWALKEAQDALDRGKKKSMLTLPVDRIHHLLQKDLLCYKIDSSVSLFLVAVLEYISADILKLVGNYAKNIKHVEITYQDVQISMKVDKALMDMFYQDEGGGSISEKFTEKKVVSALTQPRTSLTYEDTVREMLASEKVYLKELHMIIKVFREEIKKLTSDPKDIDLIFSNIMEIYELTYTLAGSLEDVMEMAQEQMPYIGSCFEELAEAEEFQAYSDYAKDVTDVKCRETLDNLLSRPDVQKTLQTAGQGMPLALKYYLPELLMGPIWHFFSYMDYIEVLIGLSPALEDKETLTQVHGLLKPLKKELADYVPPQSLNSRSSATLNQTKARRQTAIVKIQELEKLVENWDSKDLGQCCNEFVREDVLIKVSQKRLTERRVFLFDGLMILCKPRRQTSIHHTTQPDYRLKERFFMRKVEIKDHDDTDEIKHAFEIQPRQTPSVVLCAKTLEEKNSWMADLVMLNNRSMLERVLDSILSMIEQQHPLKLPPPDLYKFAVPDSEENLILEQRENGGVPLIKGATLYKLVERLTYHIYADPKFIRTFLTTYRSFCSPTELLDLLIERFRIPDPSLVYEQDPSDTEKMQKNFQREDWKKYRKEYMQPVQFRVLNVLRHWVDQHFYDFERDVELLSKLRSFLDCESDNGKGMKKWVNSVMKIVQRKLDVDSQKHTKNIAFCQPAPPIEWHIPCNEEEYGVLTLHPLEIARQLTIIEFDLYRLIKPSELVGAVWMKKEKDKTSPNLLKMIKHTTNFTRWLEKNIVESENFEERVAMVNRICEIMIACDDMNNFNGVLAISSAMQSAAVHRLRFTFQAINPQYKKILDKSNDDHFKKYLEKLRSINPPCVPFLGMYLTNILHIEEGNPDFFKTKAETQLINFFKRRKVAEITGEIQQYQNQPYCFKAEPQIKAFLETLNPFDDLNDTEISDRLYKKSLEIEPRNCKQLPKFPRKWPNLNLKSPGIKPKRSATSVLANTVNTMSSTIKSDDSKSEDSSSKSENDYSVFASVQLGPNNAQLTAGGTGGHNSPTMSPNSPAAPSSSFTNWFGGHSRSPSVSSVMSIHRASRSDSSGMPYPRYTISSQSSSTTGGPSSPGPHSPASPGPHSICGSLEPISPRLLSSANPPPTPPPLPPRCKRRDSPEINSPQQVKQAPDAPPLPARENISPPPLPPRREPGPSPGTLSAHCMGGAPHHQHFGGPASFHSNTLPHPHGSSAHHHKSSFPANHAPLVAPRLNPTHTSQLHMRRHAAHPPPLQRAVVGGATPVGSGTATITSTGESPRELALNGQPSLPLSTSPAKPPTISPRYGTTSTTTSNHGTVGHSSSHSASSDSSAPITPQLPPRPAVRSAGLISGTMFQYPNTTNT